MAIVFILKVNIKLSLCLIKHHAINTVWRSGGKAPPLDGGEWSVSLLGRITLGVRWTGGWVSLHRWSEHCVVEKRSCPYRESNPGRSTPSP
jgi:hypothetical protein